MIIVILSVTSQTEISIVNRDKNSQEKFIVPAILGDSL